MTLIPRSNCCMPAASCCCWKLRVTVGIVRLVKVRYGTITVPNHVGPAAPAAAAAVPDPAAAIAQVTIGLLCYGAVAYTVRSEGCCCNETGITVGATVMQPGAADA